MAGGPVLRNNFNFPTPVFSDETNYVTNKLKPVEWSIIKKNPFGKPQAEVDFACVYNL